MYASRSNFERGHVVSQEHNIVLSILLLFFERVLIIELEHLQGNGQVIIDLVPQFSLIIGPQPVLPELPPAEARHRIHQTFEQFFSALGQQSKVTSIFIDDMQWADVATVQLIQHLVNKNYSSNLSFCH
mgnify:CR=1 FL=1